VIEEKDTAMLQSMAVSSEDRRSQRRPRATATFGRQADAALDALALLDMAWHDCYSEVAPPESVLHDVWAVSEGDLAAFVSAAYLAVIDFRDLRMNADSVRHR
jgi:hypothetical protein